MMLWRDVDGKLDFDLLVPRRRCVVVENRTGKLRHEVLSALTGSTVNALKMKFYALVETLANQISISPPTASHQSHRNSSLAPSPPSCALARKSSDSRTTTTADTRKDGSGRLCKDSNHVRSNQETLTPRWSALRRAELERV